MGQVCPFVGQKNVENEVSEFEGSLLAESPGPIPALSIVKYFVVPQLYIQWNKDIDEFYTASGKR